MNTEYKAVIWLTIILNILHTYVYVYEPEQMDTVDVKIYYFSIVASIILIALTYFDLPTEKRKLLKDIYHSLFTIYLLIAPLVVNTHFGMLSYIVLVSITLGCWILNKNGCLITAMKRDEHEPRQKHFIRKGWIKKFKIHYLVVIGGFFYVSRNMYLKNKLLS